MSTYRLGLALPTHATGKHDYRRGLQTQTRVGVVSGGFFQTELHSLDSEIMQMDKAIGLTRGLDSTGLPKTVSVERDQWWQAIWVPFLQGWKSFYDNYTSGWKSIDFPIATSRLEQMEDFRRKFIALHNQARDLFQDTVVSDLPDPTPPKTYPSWWDDLLGGLSGGARGLVKWVIIAGVVLFVFYIVAKKVGALP